MHSTSSRAVSFSVVSRLARLSCLSAAVLVGTLASLPGCAAPSSTTADEGVESSEDELRTSYGNLVDTLAEVDLDRWMSVRTKLAAGFDRICGDTICSGDYSNLATVRVACSSTTKARKMKDCAWVLGGSIDTVDGRTGKITTETRAFTCKIPVAGNAKTFLDTLSAAGDGALDAKLPGTDASFYDGLVACFSGVVGSPIASSDKTFYAELTDHFWETSEPAALAWLETKRTLAKSFDDACGDSFCEGDYSDITPLRFACSVNQNTKRVSRCTWSFAAADLSVDRRGMFTARTTTKKCNIEVGATASALTAALAGADPLHAKLPGKTTSIYDALIGCL